MFCSNGRPDGKTKEEKHYKLVEKRMSVKKSKFQCASRKKETLISKLRLGKCALNRHLFKMRRHADGKCQTCPQEDETVQHFLVEFPAQSSLRRAIRDKINLLELNSMLSNTASVELIYQWIYKNRRNLIWPSITLWKLLLSSLFVAFSVVFVVVLFITLRWGH